MLYLNAEGERIVTSGHGLAVRNGHLSMDDTRFAAELGRMMSRALGIARDAELARLKPIRIPQKAGPRCYELLVIPVTDGAQQDVLPPAAAFIVAITDPGRVSGNGQQHLQGLGLTQAESRLCEALIRTGSLPDAAELLHIRRSTARSHLKHIFAKLGVTSQVQLVTRLTSARAETPW